MNLPGGGFGQARVFSRLALRLGPVPRLAIRRYHHALSVQDLLVLPKVEFMSKLC